MKKYSAEEKKKWLEDWRQSVKSAWGYAKENGLTPQTFLKWSKFHAESSDSFVQVSAPVFPSEHYRRDILIEKGDVKIHISVYLSSNELAAVIESLGRVL